jgi:hypothetical protein
MATCDVKLTLDEIDDRVVEIYQKLMSASTDKDSVYIKAKETLKSILDDSGLDARERANVLSTTIAGMVNGISAQAMQGAIDLAKDDRDAEYVLAKLCADTVLEQAQTAKIEADTLDTEANTNLKIAQGWKLQAELHRDYGVYPDHLVGYTKEMLVGTDYNETYGTKAEELRLAKANVYNQYSSGWRQNGLVNIALDSDGFLTGSTTSGDDDTAGYAGLSYWQTRVAERNERGFDDNMRQHVANSSASMMSMLLTTEIAGIDYGPFIAQWGNAIGYLNGNEWIYTDDDPETNDWKSTLTTKYQ